MRTGWRSHILKSLVPRISRLTLVADPDGLLAEERLSTEITRRGFKTILFDDPIAFRFAYESGYRTYWDRVKLPTLL